MKCEEIKTLVQPLPVVMLEGSSVMCGEEGLQNMSPAAAASRQTKIKKPFAISLFKHTHHLDSSYFNKIDIHTMLDVDLNRKTKGEFKRS